MSRPFQIISLAERTPDWWDWRRRGVGSSDAASIMGVKHAKSVERLLFEKRHPPKENGRSYVRRQGAALERVARADYCRTVEVKLEPRCVQSVERPWQRASLDGLSEDGERVVEIKCGLATYQSVAQRSRPGRLHYPQLQHILAVTGLPVIDYWCYCPPHPPLRLEVTRDESHLARLLLAEEVFWKRLVVETATP